MRPDGCPWSFGIRCSSNLCEQGLISALLSFFQIDDPDSNLEEVIDEADAVSSVNNLGSKQALNADYLDSDYEIGQLYPFPLNSDLQMPTFPLTNSVPMTQSFRERWHMNLDSLMDRALIPHCSKGKDLYILTGAVPSEHKVKGKVTIPEFIWLAACCAVPGGGWAMGFIKHTQDSNVIEDVMLRDLEKLLPHKPQLFQDNCGEMEQDNHSTTSLPPFSANDMYLTVIHVS